MARNPILWQPDDERIRASATHRFMTAQGYADYDALYAWSIDRPAAFWEAIAGFFDDGEFFVFADRKLRDQWVDSIADGTLEQSKSNCKDAEQRLRGADDQNE